MYQRTGKFRWNVMERAVMNHCREHFIQEALGEAKKDAVQILLAHNPMFAKEYADWGADITVCGHTHGGLVRIPGIGSVISPQFELFPKYDAGEFEFDGKKVYVSKGLGTHTFHIRVLTVPRY